MKKLILKLIVSLIFVPFYSCVSVNTQKSAATVESDLFPNNISRTMYYENLADGFASSGQYEQAADLYKLSILHDTKNSSSRIKLSDAYRKTKNDNLADIELNEVLKSQPNNKLAISKLVDLYVSAKVYSKAKELLKQLIVLNPNDKKSQWSLYFIYRTEEQYELAFSQLDTIQGEDSEQNIDVVLEKANLYKLLKQDDKHLDILKQAYENKPNYYPIVDLLSNAYFDSKNWSDAYTILNRYTETNAFNYAISERLSFCAIQTKNYETALNEFAKQKANYPDLKRIELKMAHTYFLNQQYEQSENGYLSYLTIQPNDEAYYYLSKIYQITNRANESKGYLKKIETASDYYVLAQVELADLEKVNNLKDAIESISIAHSNRPESLEIYKTYADLLIADRQYYEVIVLLEDGINAYPNDEDLRLKISYAFYQIDNRESFQQQIKEAIVINPKYEQIYTALSNLWLSKNKKSLEVDYFTKQVLDSNSSNIDLKPMLAWTLMDHKKSTEVIAIFEKFYEQNPNEYFYAKSLAEIYQYAYIDKKAQQFTQIAYSIESTQRLNSVLLNQSVPGSNQAEASATSESRLPASLENY